MNQDWVQRELGVPLNFTVGSNNIVNTYFGVTGDPFKVTIDTINEVAKGGVKVALVYGDRDYRCNCKFSLSYTFSPQHAMHSCIAFRMLILPLSCSIHHPNNVAQG
jgi:hypothetical protein